MAASCLIALLTDRSSILRRCAVVFSLGKADPLFPLAPQKIFHPTKRGAIGKSRAPPHSSSAWSRAGAKSLLWRAVIAAPVRAGAPTRAKAAAQADQRSCA